MKGHRIRAMLGGSLACGLLFATAFCVLSPRPAEAASCTPGQGANLKGCNFAHKDLANADLGGANLTSTDLDGTNLTDAYLNGADLTAANLTNAKLTNATLTNAKLTNATLTGVTLTGADLAGVTSGKITRSAGSAAGRMATSGRLSHR